jgi:hypothetical protein
LLKDKIEELHMFLDLLGSKPVVVSGAVSRIITQPGVPKHSQHGRKETWFCDSCDVPIASYTK